MPTLQNPGHYEHAGWVASDRADAFLKWLDNDEYTEITGNVESPIGWVGLVRITAEMIATWVATDGDAWLSSRNHFAPGWYIVRINSDGLVFGMGYGGYCETHQEFCADTLQEGHARADFESAERAYAEWDES